jgi:benzoate/toluate 1,2-dioxygenase beta subunit
METADDGGAEFGRAAGAVSVTAQTKHDPSRTSHYVSDALYQELVDGYTGWQREDMIVEDPRVCARFQRLLNREARLLDQLKYEEWLTLYAPEFIYWVPSTPDGGDPRREVAVTFDDRRRVEDRVFRFRTGYAWSQAPPSRTVRLIGNAEVFRTAQAAVTMVRSNFVINEFWDNATRTLCGWAGHRIAERDGGLAIQCKQVNLIECDQSLRNPSIIL